MVGFLAEGYLRKKTDPMSDIFDRFRMEPFSFGAYRSLKSLIAGS
jgi:hypothetical protein